MGYCLPLSQSKFCFLGLQVDQGEQDRFVLLPENAARNFSEKLFENRRDRVHGEAVDVDEPTLLQEVDQLVHVALKKLNNIVLEAILLAFCAFVAKLSRRYNG